MKRAFGILLLLMLWCSRFVGYSQILLFSIPVGEDSLISDPLGNLYLLKGSQITKYDPSGKLLMRFSNKVLGEIASADASNPMKILLFSPVLNRIVFLDSQLSENGPPVDLSESGLDQTILACTSHDNGFWVYDQREFELLRLNQELQISHRSGNIPLQTGLPVKPSAVYQYQNKVYLYDKQTGFLVFDIFGAYTKTIPLKSVESVSFSEDCIFFIREEKLFSFNLITLEEEERALPVAGILQALMLKERLLLKTPGMVWVFSRN